MTSKVGCGSIVLFHNAGEHTPEALPELLTGDYTLDHEGRQHPAG